MLLKRLNSSYLIARDHREAFGQTYHGELASGLDELEGWRVHGNLTHKVARGGQFHLLQSDLVHARGYDLEKGLIPLSQIDSSSKRSRFVQDSSRYVSVCMIFIHF